MNSPICIGGVGGSGTRVIATILSSLSINIGRDINEACDNLTFTLLFKRKDILKQSDDNFNHLINIFEKSFTDEKFNNEDIKLIYSLTNDRPGHPIEWLEKRANNLINKIYDYDSWDDKLNKNKPEQLIKNFKSLTKNKIITPLENGWGWKEPNTHIILERLLLYYPNLKYIHVIRNGLDMAFSDNQNQVKLWGYLYLKESDFKNIHYASLKFWCVVHKKIIKIGKKMGDNFLLLNYDKLCLNPKKYLKKICKFLNISKKAVSGLLPLIRPPESIGRFKNEDLSIFDKKDIEYVKKLGFDIE